ncbi:AAA family ATPase [bacterium]|nr:AAA family ATPase [bacterium]
MFDIPRKIHEALDAWSQGAQRKPFVLRGARQVGKSYAVRGWAKRNVPEDRFLELNLEREESARHLFRGDLRPDRILQDLQLFSGKNLREKGACLFIDEIQYAPRAITALRYFYEEIPDLFLIAAGSLIDFSLANISFPVGRVQQHFMFPLTFAEFLTACGEEHLATYLNEAPLDEEINPAIHQKFLQLLKDYYYVGGMPEAVRVYLDSRDLSQVSAFHGQLLAAFREDFQKYAKNNEIEALATTFERVPHLVGDPRVKYVQVDRHIHSDKIKRSLLLCEKANLLTRVHSTYASSLPLAAGADKKFFKIIFLDIGLLHHLLGFDWRQVSPDADLTNICHGAFAEQFVGQELLAHADILDQRNLYYWYRKAKGSDAEVDYVVSSRGSPAPVEVKSGSRGTLKSLNMYIEKYQPKEAFVLSQRNIERVDSVRFLPLYFAHRLAMGF